MSDRMPDSIEADVAIIGGGMVGASLAIALARACPELSIQVLEAVEMPPPGTELVYQPSYDARSTALSYGSRRIFERLGIWSDLRRNLAPIERIHVSDQGQFGTTRLQARDYRLDALGYVVENQWLGRVLWAALGQFSNIRFRCPVQVREIEAGPGRVSLALQDAQGAQSRLMARLAVLADGGRSDLRRRLGIPLDTREYGQAALVANVSTERFHDHVAYERFTPNGPMALLPLTGFEETCRSALIWTLPAEQAQHLVSAPSEEFLSRLQAGFGHRLGRFLAVGARQLYPLALERALEQVRPGLVLVGNAAHMLHPVAGQGFNLALREVAGLAQQIALAARDGRWIGGLDVLQAFEEEQRLDQERTLSFSDGLIRLFGQRGFPWQPGRGLGLLSLDLFGPLKEGFARYAMGVGGREAVLE